MLNFIRFNSEKLSNKGQRRDIGGGGGGREKGGKKEQKMGEERVEWTWTKHKETRVKNWNVKDTRAKIENVKGARVKSK